jgi:hypothetical protein
MAESVMNKTTIAKQAKTANSSLPAQGLLQRTCACGNHTVAGGECATCAKKKSGLQRKLAIGASNDPLEREADRVADQVLAAPAHPAVSGVSPRIQRYTAQASGQMDAAPASVDRVLASPGRPLDTTLQQDMEQRFGYDFSRVRVHSSAAAEQSAQDVNAHAYTVGHNMVFGAGRFAPGTHAGRRLIAHELTHVVQQGSQPPQGKLPIAQSNSSGEAEAQSAASAVQAGGPVVVGGTGGPALARQPLSLNESVDPGGLSFSQAKPTAQSAAARRPRSLRKSVDPTSLSDGELFEEIDLIHEWLQGNPTKNERKDLKMALAPFEAEAERRKGQAKAQARAAKIQRAITPKVSTKGAEALVEMLGVVENIRPSEAASGLYTLLWEGELITLTEEEVGKIRAVAVKEIRSRLPRIMSKAQEGRYRYALQREVEKENRIVSFVVEALQAQIGVNPDPGVAVMISAAQAQIAVNRAEILLHQGKLSEAGRAMVSGEAAAIKAHRLSYAYVTGFISAGESTITALEITRDVSFGIAIGIGAILAAPIVAAGVGPGITGTVATGAILTGGGAVLGGELRASTSAAGQALTGKGVDWDEVEKERSIGRKRGAVDALSAFTGARVASALGVGAQGSGAVANIVKSGRVGGASGGVGSGLRATLEGKSPEEIVKETFKGTGIGAFGGLVGGVANQALGSNSAGSRFLGGFAGGSAAGGAAAAIEGGDVTQSIIVGGLAGGVSSTADHSPKPVKPTPAAKLVPTKQIPLSKRVGPIGKLYLAGRMTSAEIFPETLDIAGGRVPGLVAPSAKALTVPARVAPEANATSAPFNAATSTPTGATNATTTPSQDLTMPRGIDLSQRLQTPAPTRVPGNTSTSTPTGAANATTTPSQDLTMPRGIDLSQRLQTPAPTRVPGTEVWEEILSELGFNPAQARPTTSHRQQAQDTVSDAVAGGWVDQQGNPRTVHAAVQPHRRAPDFRAAFGQTGAQRQSAHAAATSLLITIQGYSRALANTVSLDPATHRAFDQHWMRWISNRRRAIRAFGSTDYTAPLSDVLEAQRQAIQQTPNLTAKQRSTFEWLIELEIQGLADGLPDGMATRVPLPAVLGS